MAQPGGFIDLRVGHGARGVGDDSVWPSFTDIMTVIVMIFLMALVVIMVRNFELDRELVTTLSDKEATLSVNQELVEQLIRLESTLKFTENQRSSLERKLDQELERLAALSADQTRLQDQLEMLIQVRTALEEDNTRLNAEQQSALDEINRLTAGELALNQRISDLAQELEGLKLDSTERISALSEDKRSLEDKLDAVSVQLSEVRTLLSQATTDKQALSSELADLQGLNQAQEEQFALAAEEINVLKTLIRQREAENAALQAQADTSLNQFQSLQEEYDSLDAKYRKLIRPARSTAGKYVVEVWIEKSPSGMRYRFREPDQTEPADVSKVQLDLTLQALKNNHGKSLYTKIVIPEYSGLSHNEAWDFTQEILQKYDYYYQ